jgi:glutaredoxin
MRLTLITRVDCHLCDVAKEAIARVAATAAARGVVVDLEELDVDADPVRQEEYWDRVPVILLDGREHGYWRVEETRLLRDLGVT